MNAQVPKPFEEIPGYLEGKKRIVLMGCGGCATIFHSGGPKEIDEMVEKIAKERKDVTRKIGLPYLMPSTTWTILAKWYSSKRVGWKDLVDGKGSGIWRVNSLARLLNVAAGMATNTAQEAYERMYDFFGRKPAYNTHAFHWTPLVENLYAAERCLELIQGPEITSEI